MKEHIGSFVGVYFNVRLPPQAVGSLGGGAEIKGHQRLSVLSSLVFLPLSPAPLHPLPHRHSAGWVQWAGKTITATQLPFCSSNRCRVTCETPPPQAFVVKRLLEYTQQEESDLGYGLLLVLGLLATELVRSWSLALTWALNYRTGTRLRGAILSLTFQKILRLRSIRDKSVGQVWSCVCAFRPPLCYFPFAVLFCL